MLSLKINLVAKPSISNELATKISFRFLLLIISQYYNHYELDMMWFERFSNYLLIPTSDYFQVQYIFQTQYNQKRVVFKHNNILYICPG